MSILGFLRKPFVVEGLRVAAIMGVGDVFAQTIVEKKRLSDINIKRTLKFASVGLFFVGPTLRFWYGHLEQLVAPNQKPFTRALKKMAIDQLIFAPIFCAAIIGVFGKVNQESNDRIIKRLRNDYADIMMRNYLLWPAAQLVNFSVVPLSYQVIFAQFVAIIWNTYMSLVLNKA